MSLDTVLVPSHSLAEKSVDFIIENTGGFCRDGGIYDSNPLPGGFTDPCRLVASLDDVDMSPISTNLLITVLAVS